MRLMPPSLRVPLTDDTFRALARSSPWLWTSVDFDLVQRGEGTSSRRRCQVRRPDYARAVDENGRVIEAREELGRGWGASIGFVDAEVEGAFEASFRWAADTDPLLDEHGLVARQTNEFRVQRDAPVIENYRFVALLDPMELADGQPSEAEETEMLPDGVDLGDLREQPRRGRRTWWATAEPRQTYNPRCSCCALLPGQVSDRLLAEESGGTLPPPTPGQAARVFRVGLDVGTGICVSVTALDGAQAGDGFEVEILRVDHEGA